MTDHHQKTAETNGLLKTTLDETETIRADLEQRRQHYWQIYTMVIPMLFAASCAVAAMASDHETFPWPIIVFVTFASAVIGFQIINALYRRKTKTAFLNKIAESLGLTYNENGLFPVSAVAHHQILPGYDIHRVEDGFSGSINGVPIAFEEAILSERYKDDDGEWQERMTFWGLIIRIGIGKVLKDHTIIMPRNKINLFFRTKLSKFQPVNLVSPEFEKRFDTISTDQVEARYVLDPAFMQRFMEADTLAATKWLAASFHGQEIAIAIQHFKPLFEIGAVWKPLSESSLASVLEELNLILRMIETLKLNPNTGLGAAIPVKNAPKG